MDLNATPTDLVRLLARSPAAIEAAARARLPAPREVYRAVVEERPDAHCMLRLTVPVSSHDPLPLRATADDMRAYNRAAAVLALTFELVFVRGDAPGPNGFVCVDPGDPGEPDEPGGRRSRSPVWARWERVG
jgi:hypothetical protein